MRNANWGRGTGRGGEGDGGKSEETRTGELRQLRGAGRRMGHPCPIPPHHSGQLTSRPGAELGVYVVDCEFLVWDASSSTEKK